MLKKQRSHQTNLMFTEEIYQALVPKDHFLYLVNEKVDFSFANDLCQHLFNDEKGRPVVNFPERMLRAEFVQTYYNYSDREMEQAANFNIVVKWFLGYNLVDDAFDYSALSHFRALAGLDLHKKMFDKVLDQLVDKGLVKKDERQFIDATHNEAGIRPPTTIQLIFRAIVALVSEVRKASEPMFKAISQKVKLDNILMKNSKGEFKEPFEHNLKEHEKRKKLVELVLLAEKLIVAVDDYLKDTKMDIDPGARHKIEALIDLLERILSENIIEEPAPEEHERKFSKKKPDKDSLVSLVDKDCRYGAKTNKQKFTGYKTTFTATSKGIITGVYVAPGNQHDTDALVPMIDEMKRSHGLKPKKIGGDKAYGGGNNRNKMARRKIQLVSPMKKQYNPHGEDLFINDVFIRDTNRNSVLCPNGERSDSSFHDRSNNNTAYEFSPNVCGRCKLKKKCTNADHRRVCISDFEIDFQKAMAYNKTDDFKNDMRHRTVMERINSEVKGQHGLRRAKYWGLAKMKIQVYIAAIVVNVKRFVSWSRREEDYPLGMGG
jgi:IS5 family transposase